MPIRMTGFGRPVISVAARCLCGLVLLGLLNTAALAEVCDKGVGLGWLPEHGPTVLFGMGWRASLGLALLCALGVRMRVVPAPIVIGIGVVATLFGCMVMTDLIEDHPIIRSALAEGCRAVWADVVGLSFGVAMLAIGWRLRRGASAGETMAR